MTLSFAATHPHPQTISPKRARGDEWARAWANDLGGAFSAPCKLRVTPHFQLPRHR